MNGELREREEHAIDDASAAPAAENPRFALLTMRALVVELWTNFCKLEICFSESVA